MEPVRIKEETALDIRLTIENTLVLNKKSDNDIARGTRRRISCKGKTGYGAQYFSVITKEKARKALEAKRKTTKGSVHCISSVAPKSMATKKQPNAPARVIAPK